MGGWNSGRSGGRPTVESGLTLSLDKLMRDGLVRRECRKAGSLVWRVVGSGERVGSVGYQAHLGSEFGHLRLHYTVTRWDSEKMPMDYPIELVTTAAPFGGRRWWFECPKTGVRASKLYLPSGAATFASRQAYRLAYKSQRETPHDRALGRAFKMRRRLGSHDGIGEFIAKPKGMHWRTFNRHLERIEVAEELVEAHTAYLVQRLFRIGDGSHVS